MHLKNEFCHFAFQVECISNYLRIKHFSVDCSLSFHRLKVSGYIPDENENIFRDDTFFSVVRQFFLIKQTHQQRNNVSKLHILEEK